MNEESLIASYTIREHSTDRLTLEISMDLRMQIKYVSIMVGTIEAILICIFLIFEFTIIEDKIWMLYGLLIFTIPSAVVLAIMFTFKKGIMYLELDKKSSSLSISRRFVTSKERAHYFNKFDGYPLDWMRTIKMSLASELQCPWYWLIRRMYKGKHVLSFTVMNQLDLYALMPRIIFIDSEPGRIQALKTLIDAFINGI